MCSHIHSQSNATDTFPMYGPPGLHGAIAASSSLSGLDFDGELHLIAPYCVHNPFTNLIDFNDKLKTSFLSLLTDFSKLFQGGYS